MLFMLFNCLFSLLAGVTAPSGSLFSSLCTSVSLASMSCSVSASLVGVPGEKTKQKEMATSPFFIRKVHLNQKITISILV